MRRFSKKTKLLNFVLLRNPSQMDDERSMTPQNLEIRLNAKEAANYFSNAAALYVLGVGFCVFAVKAQSPFMGGVCLWFSVFLLCDCLRLARASQRLDRNNN